MFDKLIDFILGQIRSIVPIATIHVYQGGCMYTFGKRPRPLLPGWYFKFPYINTCAVDNVVDTTMLLPAQSLQTKDNRQIIVKGSIGFKVIDFLKFFNNVYDTKSALSDRANVIIKELVITNNFDSISDLVFDISLAAKLQSQVKKYGIKVQYAALIDITESRSFRLFNETATLL
jgi:regulator of protease activity HflC (stomatin/prohibitin superfamily)